MSATLIAIGEPTHLATPRSGWSACGLSNRFTTSEPSAVNCLRCRKTKAFRAGPPSCPKCGNNRQVWRNQLTGVMTCHRVGCHIEVAQ